MKIESYAECELALKLDEYELLTKALDAYFIGSELSDSPESCLRESEAVLAVSMLASRFQEIKKLADMCQ